MEVAHRESYFYSSKEIVWSDMRSLVFFFNNQWQSGTLLRSSSRDPQYYWFFFDTNVLADEADQYLSFVLNDDKVAATKTYAEQYRPLVESIQKQIEQLLVRERHRRDIH